MTLTCIDLFCGCGGLSKGLQLAGIKVVCGIDIWNVAINTYKHNFEHTAICGDIQKMDPTEVAEEIGLNEVNVIAGGIPCQAYSMAGKRDPNDPRAYLYKDFMRFVDFFKPQYVVIENVIGILTVKDANGKYIKDIIFNELHNRGYTVTHSTLYGPKYGVPQKRRRVFIIASAKGVESPSFPPPVECATEDVFPPVRSILLPRVEVSLSYYHSQKMIDGFNTRREKNKKAGKGFGAQYLDFDKPSFTISARYYKDGADALVKYSDTEVRKLTEREVARIQSFPDDYVFTGSSREIYMQIGNAVPVRLAMHVGKCLLAD